MTLTSIIQRSFKIIIIQTYNFVLHNIYLPSYNSWHIFLCLTLWCSFLCFALQINSYERETCFWKLEDGKGGLYVLCFLSFPGGECGAYLPNASETMSNLSSTSSFHAFYIWLVVWNKPEQSEQWKSVLHNDYSTNLFFSWRANGMMLILFVQIHLFLYLFRNALKK